MTIDRQLTPGAVLEEMGQRIVRRRLDLGVTQADATEKERKRVFSKRETKPKDEWHWGDEKCATKPH